MVMAQPLLSLLHQRGYTIDILALPWIHRMLSRIPYICNVIEMPIGHGQLALGRRRCIGYSLRSCKYDQAIVLPNTFKSALIPFFARIKQRTGFHGEMRYGLLNDRRQLKASQMPRLVQQYYSLGLHKLDEIPAKIPYPELCIDMQQRQMTLEILGVKLSDQLIIALCPGAEYGEAKRWPAKYYAELADQLLNRNYAVWLFGSAKDKAICELINEHNNKRCLNLAGKTQLDQSIDLMSLVSVAVVNDSGLMHVACALGLKTIAIYGSTSPDYTPPLSDDAHVITLNLKCSPCFKRVCPLGHLDCLNNIPVSQVFDKVLHE